jgi:mono/diheme cytochrome c family protein
MKYPTLPRAILFTVIGITMALAYSAAAHAAGADVFAANCAVCHQSDGQGVQGVYPALAGTVGNYVHSPAGRAYLVQVVSFGMSGAIESRGAEYNGFMQPWPQLSDREIAAVLNYILTKFNAQTLPAGFKPYTAPEVRHLRAASLSFDQVRAERAAMVKPLAASAMKAH